MITKHGAYCQGQSNVDNRDQKQDLDELRHMVFTKKKSLQ